MNIQDHILALIKYYYNFYEIILVSITNVFTTFFGCVINGRSNSWSGHDFGSPIQQKAFSYYTFLPLAKGTLKRGVAKEKQTHLHNKWGTLSSPLTNLAGKNKMI